MLEERFVLEDSMGLHARPAAELMMALRNLECRVTISGKGQTVNGKDVIDILSLGCVQGDEITFQAEGPDEGKAMDAIRRIMKDLDR
ncbi:MAG: HPr family phosphocarrier protein [Clostridium sp.]|nr:HPr family phosphocarrier protein [Clostridium sp.]